MPAEHHADKRTYNPAKLAEQVTRSLIEGKGSGLRRDPRLGNVTDADIKVIARITGETVEKFNARITEKLRIIEDLAAERAIEALEAGAFKPSELGFILSVAHDKRTHIDGTSQLTNASVNVQINNFGSPSKSALLDQLEGRVIKQVEDVIETFPSAPSVDSVAATAPPRESR